jgi:tRNA threonylcarbamoyladenosine biosynthesis protein TsaB
LCFILNIESTSTVCSVALSSENFILGVKELSGSLSHAENLHLFIQQVLESSNIKAQQLNAIAISKGPGSYTGLRIGSSTAKGLAFALKIPLIAVDTLQAMSSQCVDRGTEDSLLCPLIDARRMEVYTAAYDQHLNEVVPVNALIVDEAGKEIFNRGRELFFFGNGMPKCKEILRALPNANFIEGIEPSASLMAGLSYQKYLDKTFEDTAYFEPFYLKEFYTPQKK